MRKNMVRLSDFEHKQLEKARELLMQKGIGKLPKIEPYCPKCGKLLNGFKISYQYIKCPHCDYEEQSAALTALGSFALGAIVALGAVSLIKFLSKKDEDNK